MTEQGAKMTDAELLEKAKEIIANGCGCDRGCTELVGADIYCGCENDAKKVIELVRSVTTDKGT